MLEFSAALDRIDLLAEPTATLLSNWQGNVPVGEILVAEIDPNLADTAEFCERYQWTLEDSANCVVIAGKRGDEVRMAACVILATTRADVNSVVRKRLDAKKASFAPMDDAVAQTGMEFGGITPFGLPADWPILIDPRVIERERAVYGSGLRKSKLFAPGKTLLDLPNAEVIEGLANPVE